MRLINASKKTDARSSFNEHQWQKETKTPRFERNEKLILIFVLLFRRGIKISSQRLRIFVCNCSTIVTPKKALCDVTSLLGDLVIAHRTNFVVIESFQKHLEHFMINVLELLKEHVCEMPGYTLEKLKQLFSVVFWSKLLKSQRFTPR